MTFAASAPVPQTCYSIIQDAYTDSGLLGEGDEPDSEMLANGMRRLNKIVNYFGTKGIKLWVQEDLAIMAPILQAGVSFYSAGPTGTVVMFAKPRRAIEGYYTDVNKTKRPLLLLSRQEWDTLSTTTQPGTITAFWPDKQFNNVGINLWMTPDAQAATGAVHIIWDLQLPNFAMLTDTMVFPAEWALTLEWGLAGQLCTGQPQPVIDRCMLNAERYQQELEDWDVEDASTKFQPDTQMNASRRIRY